MVTYEAGGALGFEARLYLWAPDAAEPSWAGFLREGFGSSVEVAETAVNRAVVVLRVHYFNADRYFAIPFGAGRFLLRTDAFERSYGLRAALNVIYEGDSPDASAALARVRRVDAKTVAQNTLRTLRQANRYATFEEFGVDIQRDLLGAVSGQPADVGAWGSRIAGHDPLHLNVKVRFADLGDLCRRIWRVARKDDYRVRFDWIDHIRVVTDPSLIRRLTEALVAELRTGEPAQIELAPPELIDWDEVESFTYSLDPDDGHADLSLVDYLRLVDLDTLSLDQLKRHRISAQTAGGDVTQEWSAFRCLTGEIAVEGTTYLVEDAEFFEVEPSFLAELDAYLGGLIESPLALPDSPLVNGREQSEGDYNRVAAESSPNHLLLDKETVRVTTHTDPIEICDILTTDRRFVHVKRKLQSSSLSHLFAQGFVSADLFLMSAEYRTVTRERIVRAEEARAISSGDLGFRGRFSTLFDFDSPTPSNVEVVYGIVARWGGRSMADALPFFSKVNLRRHAEDLRRMAYRVSYKRIHVV
jgi:uncharacterized protein (TIGR04141 family)